MDCTGSTTNTSSVPQVPQISSTNFSPNNGFSGVYFPISPSLTNPGSPPFLKQLMVLKDQRIDRLENQVHRLEMDLLNKNRILQGVSSQCSTPTRPPAYPFNMINYHGRRMFPSPPLLSSSSNSNNSSEGDAEDNRLLVDFFTKFVKKKLDNDNYPHHPCSSLNSASTNAIRKKKIRKLRRRL